MIKNYYGAMAFVMSAIFAGSGAVASEVYIEQAGDTGVFNITQSNGANTVGTSATPAVFSGNNIQVDIIQDGTLNTAAISAVSATDTVIDYTATGSSNSLEIDIGSSDNRLTVVKNGDNNHVSMCGANDLSTAAAATNQITGSVAAGARTVGCTSEITVVDTTNIIDINGSSNAVNLALASANANNTVTIGGVNPSDYNAVNITQSGTGLHTTAITIDGNTNTVNLTQQ
jgi:hypothetical protein